MEILKDYEKKVLRLLVSDILSSGEINSIISNSELVGYEYTGSGYFLKISNPQLPEKRIICARPIVIGEVDGTTCGFVVFIENNLLTIECHSWGELNVTEDFRNKDVQVKATTIEEGQFVDLKTLF